MRGLNRRAIGIFAAMWLAMPGLSLAKEKEPKATEEELAEAQSSLQSCLTENAPLYDDGNSDAATIGKALARSCNGSFIALADTYSKGMNARTKYYTRERFLQGAPDIAATAVLRLRVAN